MPKVLLVEDDSNLREIYGAPLEAEGYEVVSASDGEEGLAVAVRERPDLIVSDVMMPKISGFDMLDILRSTPETKDVKIIVMTALSQDEDRKRGEELGADRYVVKSQVTLDDFVGIVKDVLGDTTAAPVTDNSATAPPVDTAVATPPAVSSDQSQSIPVQDEPNAPQDPYAQSPQATINTTPSPADLTKEVEQFVATSPLMNGTPPQPVQQQDQFTDQQPPLQ